MEGKSDLSDLSLLFQTGNVIKAAKALHGGIGRGVDVVHQIIIEIVDAALLELLRKDALLIALLLQVHTGQLACQKEALARVALDQRFADNVLALEAMVHISRVEIAKSARQEGVNHATDLWHVHRLRVVCVKHGQAHHAKSKFFHHISFPFDRDRQRGGTLEAVPPRRLPSLRAASVSRPARRSDHANRSKIIFCSWCC